MLTLHLIFLACIGLIGIAFNWLLILAIQRKTYHHQESHRLPSPATNISLLRPNPSMHAHMIRTPLLPALRSSISSFDKYILALLINDIFVCNFVIPLRFLDLSQGLPCVFLCFILKFFDKLTTIIELIIITLLVISSCAFFFKKHLSTTKLCLLYLLLISPVAVMYLATAFTHLDINEHAYGLRPPSCKQIFVYVTLSTYRTLNVICCVVTYLIILGQFVLLVQMKWSIKTYKRNSLRNIAEAANLTRNMQLEISLYDQNNLENLNRRSMYTPPTHNVSSATSIATDMTPTTQRSFQTFDYLTYLTIIENSQTLIKSTNLLLLIYALVHVPYWLYELFVMQWTYDFIDVYLLCHALKPFCYMSTNEKYRFHVWAILQCKPFRMLPNILRRKSRVMTLSSNTPNLNVF